MIPKHPHRLCKLPKTSRLAQLILAAPVIPIDKEHDESMAGDGVKIEAKPYHIRYNVSELPDKVYRDVQIASSHSVNDWLLAASREESFDWGDCESFAMLRDTLVKIANASLNDEKLGDTVELQHELMGKNSKIAKLQNIGDWKGIEVLGVSVYDALQSIENYAAELSTHLLREANERDQGIAGKGV